MQEICHVATLLQVFTITVPVEQEAGARDLVVSMSSSARLTYSVGGTLKFELPTSEVGSEEVYFACCCCVASTHGIVDASVCDRQHRLALWECTPR